MWKISKRNTIQKVKNDGNDNQEHIYFRAIKVCRGVFKFFIRPYLKNKIPRPTQEKGGKWTKE